MKDARCGRPGRMYVAAAAVAVLALAGGSASARGSAAEPFGAPRFEIDPGLEPAAAVRREAEAGWRHVADLAQDALESGLQDDSPASRSSRLESQGGARQIPVIRVRSARGLRGGHAASSEPGLVSLRPSRSGEVDEALVLALRHELAHQFLFRVCPQASRDTLFHEAFATAASGEAASFRDEDWLSSARAREILESSASLDSRLARRALARALDEATPAGRRLAPVLVAGLRRCGSAGRWGEPMRPAELLAPGTAAGGDAFVVLNRHSGEAIVAEGAASTPAPFGSTLKPFLAAAASAGAPVLRPRAGVAEWACGDEVPTAVDVSWALLHSCNGYFLDWARREPSIASFGAWGPVLQALGLERLPNDAAEAIGLTPALALTPLQLAQAWRLLAEASPQLVAILERNAREGTLAALGATSTALSGWATKTGTVRDSQSRPLVGWIVAVSQDLVAVRLRRGVAPRDFAEELAGRLDPFSSQTAQAAATVQVFALAPVAEVELSCPAVAVGLHGQGPELLPPRAPLPARVARGRAVCAGAPWRVKVPGRPERDYAGSFAADPVGSQAPGVRTRAADTTEIAGAQPPEPGLPRAGEEGQAAARSVVAALAGGTGRGAATARAAEPGSLPARAGSSSPAPPSSVPEKAAAARRGSDILFRTRLLSYTAGVLAAEHDALAGEPRAALARVVAHNVRTGALRHPGRSVCDTTHCQVFLGTVRARPGDEEALRRPIRQSGWLHFATGGARPWSVTRSEGAIARALGAGIVALQRVPPKVALLRRVRSDDGFYEDRETLECESLRSRLRLPSCPTAIVTIPGGYRFEGRGEGHGLGIDLESVRQSGLAQDAILDNAYRGDSGAR